MKLVSLSLTPYRLRLFFRGMFLLLAVAVVALALYLLGEEKRISYKNYQNSFRKTQAQVAGKLHHPSGQLALLNPQIGASPITPLRPLLLSFSALDFDDQYKVQQAVEMAGCLIQYRAYNSLCVAIGNNPWSGGFIYVAGSFAGTDLVEHERGDRELYNASRVRMSVQMRGDTYRWIAPYEALEGTSSSRTQGRLTGFEDKGSEVVIGKPDKEFRGWIWQDSRCVDSQKIDDKNCAKRVFFSIRLPIIGLRDALRYKTDITWPPADLNQIYAHIEVLPPGENAAPILDSNDPTATPPFALSDLKPLLLPGETLHIHKAGSGEDLIKMTGRDEQSYRSSHLIATLIRHLHVDGYDAPLQISETISTPLANYELILTGDVRSLNASIGAVATRVSWLVAAILVAIFFAWFVIEIVIVRSITRLTKRARAVSESVNVTGRFEHFDFSDLRGADELGVLAGALSDLLQRVKDDIERERIRTEQEKDMWHAVGHEIMSPLQSLMVLHGDGESDSARYIHRMQQAVRVLYGSASPSEAFESTILQLDVVNLNEFLHHVAENAPCVGIADVRYVGPEEAVSVRANEYSLEDVITHVLRNAERYRDKDSEIVIELFAGESAVFTITNQGPRIPDAFIDKIFEYGVSDQQDAAANGNRGQGLFVAKTYMAKMGGTISVKNLIDGVRFEITLPRLREY